MEATNRLEEQKIVVLHKKKDNTRFIYMLLIVLITLASLPSSVKCDTIDTLASVLLFFLIGIFGCAGIGWWSRRGDPKY